MLLQVPRITIIHIFISQIDRIFEWKKQPQVQVEDAIGSQKKMTTQEFEQRVNMVIAQFAEQVYIKILDTLISDT